MVLTVLYAGFAALTFTFSSTLLEEMAADYYEHDERNHHNTSHKSNNHFMTTAVSNFDGYIGERFDVVRTGFVAPPPAQTAHGTMA